jgi:hypothetical protein
MAERFKLPVNVRGNYNRVKVEKTALVKSGYMLESLVYPVLLDIMKIR